LWVVVYAVDYDFYAVDLEFRGLHATGENVAECKVKESRKVLVNVAAAIEQDGFNELASANTISFTKSITSHNLFVIVVSYQNSIHTCIGKATYSFDNIEHHSLDLLIGNKYVLTV
jgi:hypothetical protein